VFCLAVMAGAGYYVFLRAIEGEELVTVPNIVGVPVANAYAVLSRHNLTVGDQRETYNENTPRGHVIAQRPSAGKVVRAGRKVHPTVSVGPDQEEVPALVGMSIADAAREITRTARFGLVSEALAAKMPHTTPPGTIIGQDPPPGMRIARGGEIALLVSSGNVAGGFILRDLKGLSTEDARDTLNRLGLTPVLISMDRPDAPADTVLEHTPAPGSMVKQGDEVRLMLRMTAPTPEAFRQVQLSYTVPRSGPDREVRIDVIGKDGAAYTLFPQQGDYVGGRPPVLSGGKQVVITFSFRDEVTAMVYLDGQKAQSYHYKGGAEPVVTTFSTAP
jgi:beta-lactam-binding protein with PASTA domain